MTLPLNYSATTSQLGSIEFNEGNRIFCGDTNALYIDDVKLGARRRVNATIEDDAASIDLNSLSDMISKAFTDSSVAVTNGPTGLTAPFLISVQGSDVILVQTIIDSANNMYMRVRNKTIINDTPVYTFTNWKTIGGAV